MRVTVIAKAGSKAPGIDPQPDGSLIVRVRERAIDGAANDAITRALASRYDIAPSRVHLIRGTTTKTKIFEIG